MVSKFNEDGSMNPTTTFSAGAVVHHESSPNSTNFTRIIVPVKRFNMKPFIHAVKAQLLYFPNINFRVEHYVDREALDAGNIKYREDVNYKARVLHSSNNIVISQNSIYNKPHIIIVRDTESEDNTGVCYGYVSFEELEMETLRGNVGFRCPIKSVVENAEGFREVVQDGVNVTPSRESVIWDEETKAYIKKVIESARKEAAAIISEKIANEKNIFKWLELLNSVTNGHSDPRISGLSGIVSISDLDLKYQGTNFRKKDARMMLDAIVNVLSIDCTYSGTIRTRNVSPNSVKHYTSDKKYSMNGYSRSKTKDRYLTTQHSTFYLFKYFSYDDWEDRVFAIKDKLFVVENMTPLQKEAFVVFDIIAGIVGLSKKEWKEIDKESLTTNFKPIYNYFLKQLKEYLNMDTMKDYYEVEVPKDLERKYNEIEEKLEKQEEIQRLTAEELRKLNNEIVVHLGKTPDRLAGIPSSIVYSAVNLKIEDLDKIKVPIVYGTTKNRDELDHYVNFIISEVNAFRGIPNMSGIVSELIHQVPNPSYNAPFVVFQISAKNEKYFRSLKNAFHVDDFGLMKGEAVYSEDNKKPAITIHPEMMNQVTRYFVKERLSSRNYESIMKVVEHMNVEVYDLYLELKEIAGKSIGIQGMANMFYSKDRALAKALIGLQVRQAKGLPVDNKVVTEKWSLELDDENPFILDPNVLEKLIIFESFFEQDENAVEFIDVIGYYYENKSKTFDPSSNVGLRVKDVYDESGLTEKDIQNEVSKLQPLKIEIK